MGNLTIFDIYDEFRSSEPDPDFIIDFHNKNAIFFNNYRSFASDEELVLYIQLADAYIGSLYTKDRFNAAVDEADINLKVIDEAIDTLRAQPLKSQCKWYYDILFVKAMASYRLQDYKTAETLFKELVLIDPQNDNFSNWLSHTKFKSRSRLFHMVYIVCGILMISAIFLKNIIPPFARISFATVVLLIFVFVSIYEMWMKRSLRKAKNGN